MKLVLLQAYDQVIHAEMAKSYLQSHGIESEIHDAHIVSTQWVFSHLVGGVKLKVQEKDLQEAQRLLTELPHDLEEEELQGPECPQCHSTHTELLTQQLNSRKLLFILWIFVPGFVIPLYQKDHYQCTLCHHNWTEKQSPRPVLKLMQLMISSAILFYICAYFYMEIIQGN